ncbi:nitroreductase family protein [Pelosinus sp. sgz500959]|uniref:nitroreductase family protein n=1 Tax=Pelosinus sp. sgz500959 TaxID=3242472 RepID=UPI00366BADA9
MNEILQNILTRRSIRAYQKEQILDTELEAIIKAAQYAPSGGNSQSWHFSVVQNEEKLKELNAHVREAFKDLIIDNTTYRSKVSGKKAAESNRYNFYYHAPTLIIVSNDREYSNAMADSSVALQNIFLAAHSLHMGSCWINQLTWFGDQPKIREVLTTFGIPENYKICGAAALGYVSGNQPKATPRKEGTVTIIK